MITELTPEQMKLHDEYFQRGIDIGWCTERSDRARAEKAMLELYKIAKQDKIPKFVWFDSPKAAIKYIKEKTGQSVGLSNTDGQLDAYWFVFYDFCQAIGVKYDDEDARQLAIWGELIQSTGPCWPYDEECIMTERPTVANRDNRNQLHCDDGPALQYLDGTALYAIHNVRVPEKVVMHPETITLEDIDTEENAEVRRIMIDKYGPGRYLADTKAKVIHMDVRAGSPRALLRDKNDQQWLYGSDTSTGRMYTMPVPNDVKTCKEAHEAICGFNEDKCVGEC
jgi:hypothetical protein